MAMHLEELEPDLLWRYYQRGYNCLVRSGRYFRQVLRPALSHVYFRRALPLLVEYARANHGDGDLPASFGEQMEACPLTPRDLLHLDYAICLGYAEAQSEGLTPTVAPVLEWPGPNISHALFIAVDIGGAGEPPGVAEEYADLEEELEEEGEEDEEEDPTPPFDL
ncbi:MAG TPA: hypothetical protein VFB38_13855 [Chthonomonadaceae bacterium]|nr:hypothetical protein [Chthonomonadaceae bacterium]